MTPNLFVGLQTLATPTRWFSRKGTKATDANITGIKHFDRPVPGEYQYITGAWYLLQPDDQTTLPPDQLANLPQRVIHSHILQRPLLEYEYAARTCEAPLPALPRSRPSSVHSPDPSIRSSSRPASSRHGSHQGSQHGAADELVGFIRLDDGVTWVNHLDARGRDVEGPLRPYIVDAETGALRVMVRRDDPKWIEQRRRESRAQNRLSVEGGGGSRETSVGSSRPASPHVVWEGRRGSRVEDLREGTRPGSPRVASSRSLPPLVVPETANGEKMEEGREWKA